MLTKIMAVSKAAQEKVEVLNGLDLIWDSRAIIADILYHFREFHDLCVESKLFKDKTILNIDQCAVDFRQISFDTVTVAKRVSKQWLDSTIAFFENIDDVDDPREMLILLGRQAGDLASCFKIIAAWSRDLAGRFHQAQDGTVKEVKEFQDKFKEAEARAVDIKKQIEEKHAEAQQDREKAKDSERTWKAASISLAWIPFGFVVTAIGASFAEGRADEMAKKAAETDEKLKTAQKELQQRTSQHERAKFIAAKAGQLIVILGKMEETCEAIAAFWTEEAENYAAQGAKMATNQATMVKQMKGVVVKNNVKFWKEAKERMDRYASAMNVINNSFNFVTDARPAEAQVFGLESLKLTLHIPSTIDVKAITG